MYCVAGNAQSHHQQRHSQACRYGAEGENPLGSSCTGVHRVAHSEGTCQVSSQSGKNNAQYCFPTHPIW